MAAGGIDTGITVGSVTSAKMPWLPIFLCVAINMLDGFDVLAIAFTAPAISKAWGLDPVSLGFLLSAGLVGMGLGSLALSPIGDMYGRRVILLSCLAIISVGMLASAYTNGLYELALARLVTGLGIGGLLSGANTATAEYSPPQRRDLAIGLVTVGYPVGAVLGGIVSIDLIQMYDWRAVFIFGGLCSTVMIPIIYIFLPESLSFLVEKRPPNALARANTALKKLGREPIVILPEAPQRAKPASLLDIFGPELRSSTVAICAAFFFMMLSLYFALNWIPKNIVDMGLSQSQGISVSVLVNLAGIVGGVALGFLANSFGLRRIAGFFMVLTFVSLVVFGSVPADMNFLLAAAAFFGFAVFGAFVSLYAIVAEVFPTHARTTGTGLAIGLGRAGATIGPVLGGLLIADGWERWAYYSLLGVPCLLGAFFGTWAARRISRAA